MRELTLVSKETHGESLELTGVPMAILPTASDDLDALKLSHNRLLPPTAPDAVCALNELQGRILQLPQEAILTHHVIHGGMYARTIKLKRDTVIVGCLYKVPTMLIVNGAAQVFVGDGWAELSGYNVIPASRGRKQIFVALSEVEITMVFATKARTVEEAEAEMTDEVLLSQSIGDNVITVTGE